MEKDAEWVKPGTVYPYLSPQLPEDGQEVNLHVLPDRVVRVTFSRKGLDFFEVGTGNRWNLSNPGVRGWSV